MAKVDKMNTGCSSKTDIRSSANAKDKKSMTKEDGRVGKKKS